MNATKSRRISCPLLPRPSNSATKTGGFAPILRPSLWGGAQGDFRFAHSFSQWVAPLLFLFNLLFQMLRARLGGSLLAVESVLLVHGICEHDRSAPSIDHL